MQLQGLIAVERKLTNIQDALETEGYEVVLLDNANLDVVDAVIVSGMDANLMNMQDISTVAPVINAAGKTTAEILEELERL